MEISPKHKIMPQIFRKDLPNGGIVAVWKITESTDELFNNLQLQNEELVKVNNFRLDKRKQEFLAVRCLLKLLLNHDAKINYLPSGKPVLTNSSYYISISHTRGHAAVALSKSPFSGIDIEYPSERVTRVYQRFVSKKEQLFIPEKRKLDYYTLLWCLKETMFKLFDDSNIIFNQHFLCHPFVLENEGAINASFVKENIIEKKYHYIVTPDYYLVYYC
jgi:4'-phosphopantetheinyl transferase EntD